MLALGAALSYLTVGNLALALLVLVAAFYLVYSRNFGKFESLGLFSVPPQLFFGNLRPVLTGEQSAMEFHREYYGKVKAAGQKCAIFYDGGEAILYCADPELVKIVGNR